MGKNNRLINQYKAVYKQIQNITPEVYSAIALSLHRSRGWSQEEIEELFCVSQEIWTECVQSDINMVQMCFEETGIEVLAGVNDGGGWQG